MGLSHSTQAEKAWNDLISEWNPANAQSVQDIAHSLTKHGPIPTSLRSKAWFVISGAAELMRNNNGLYEELYLLSSDKIDLIKKDCRRTRIAASATNKWSEHDYIYNVLSLRRILIAYSNYDTSLGYCQGMNYIAGFLLDIFKESDKDNINLEEEVFWTFVVILQQIRSIFIEYSPTFKKCADIFAILCKHYLPELHNKWIKWNEPLGIDIYKLILTPWFYSLFTYPPCLHYVDTARMWDIFLMNNCDFSIFIKIAFTIIASNKDKLIKMEFMDIIDFCKHLSFMKYGGKQLIEKSISIKLSKKYAKYIKYTKDLTRFDRKKFDIQQTMVCCKYITY